MPKNFIKVIAYRGGTEIYPENSIESIRESITAFPEVIIEIDLQLTKDENIVAFHDFQLEKLTNGNGKIKDYTLSELNELSLKNTNQSSSNIFKIPSLATIFETFPNQNFILDLHEKNDILSNKIIQIVGQYKMERKIALVSIVEGATDLIRKQRPDWEFFASPKETKKFVLANKLGLGKFVKIKSGIIFLPEKMGNIKILNSNAIKILQRQNIKIFTCANFKPYQNVNSFADMERLKELGVNGIYTDNPQKLFLQ